MYTIVCYNVSIKIWRKGVKIMKKAVRILAVSLALVLCLGLGACGGKKADELNAVGKDFIKFVLSTEGQAIVTDNKAIDVKTASTKSYDTANNTVTGTLEINGSTSVEKVIKALIEAYKKVQPGATVTYEGTGSGAGRTAAEKADAGVIGVVSAALSAEQETKLDQIDFAKDAIAVVVHPDSDVTNLTKAQVAEIFKSGTAARWNAYGSANGNAIKLYCRKTGSGTRTAFEELLDIQDQVSTAGTTEQDSTSALVAGVASDADGIGYASLSEMGSSVKALSIDGVACTEENVKNGTYGIARPFAFVVAEGMKIA